MQNPPPQRKNRKIRFFLREDRGGGSIQGLVEGETREGGGRWGGKGGRWEKLGEIMQQCLIFHNQSRGEYQEKETGARNEKYRRQKVWTPQ